MTWHTITAGIILAIFIVKKGAVLPHLKFEQSISMMDWSTIELVFSESSSSAEGMIYFPERNEIYRLILEYWGGPFGLKKVPLLKKISYRIRL